MELIVRTILAEEDIRPPRTRRGGPIVQQEVNLIVSPSRLFSQPASGPVIGDITRAIIPLVPSHRNCRLIACGQSQAIFYPNSTIANTSANRKPKFKLLSERPYSHRVSRYPMSFHREKTLDRSALAKAERASCQKLAFSRAAVEELENQHSTGTSRSRAGQEAGTPTGRNF